MREQEAPHLQRDSGHHGKSSGRYEPATRHVTEHENVPNESLEDACWAWLQRTGARGDVRELDKEDLHFLESLVKSGGDAGELAGLVLAADVSSFVNAIGNDDELARKCESGRDLRRVILLGLHLGAARSDGMCANILGAMYYLGNVVRQDYGRAKELYELADSKGVVQGMVNLGYVYEYGRCGDRDYDMAYRQYAKAAAISGHFEALYKLGDMYAKGHGVTIDLRAALALYDRSLDAAEGIVQQAQPAFRIAELISKRDDSRWGIPYDPMGALSLYQLAERGLRVDIAHGHEYYRERLQQSIAGQDRMRKVLDDPGFWTKQETKQTEADTMDNEARTDTAKATLTDAVWGAAVGDALGVPYEFKSRGSFECEGMVGHGTHNQPAGTWSDDTALMLATCDSIREVGHVDAADLLARFRRWYRDGAYTPDGVVFDIGNATAEALRTGRGLSGEWDNGNGSLMRIAPLAFCDATDDEVRAVSAVTHAHPTSTEACVEFVHLLRDAAADPVGTRERLRSELAGVTRDDVRSGGYVLDTLQAAKWCFANTETYRDCVLAAVNLGSDTDTTACVAGALAGTAYGRDAVPAEWLSAMRGADVLEATLF